VAVIAINIESPKLPKMFLNFPFSLARLGNGIYFPKKL
jgi:hypothetical protein